jgi:importin subunit alpha-1
VKRSKQLTQAVIDSGGLARLGALLLSPKKGIRKEACWTISNIAAGTREQIQSVIDSNVIPPLVELLKNAEFDIKKEAAWAISNATSGGSPEQIKLLVGKQCIPPLCDLLDAKDGRIVTVALEGLENILRIGQDEKLGQTASAYGQMVEAHGGLDKIEQLQNHEQNEIYEKAMKMIQTYFGFEDEDAGIIQQYALSEQLRSQFPSGLITKEEFIQSFSR